MCPAGYYCPCGNLTIFDNLQCVCVRASDSYLLGKELFDYFDLILLIFIPPCCRACAHTLSCWRWNVLSRESTTTSSKSAWFLYRIGDSNFHLRFDLFICCLILFFHVEMFYYTIGYCLAHKLCFLYLCFEFGFLCVNQFHISMSCFICSCLSAIHCNCIQAIWSQCQ